MKKYQRLFKILSNLVKPLMLVAFFLIASITHSVFAQDWNQIIKVVASDRGAGHEFGYSVAISGDYAIVGTDQFNYLAGSAYIFKNNAGTWSEVQKIVASDGVAFDRFGNSVAISGDYAIVGALWEGEDAAGGNYLDEAGSAYIFKNNAGTWSEVQKIVASDRETWDNFGESVSISGDYVIVGVSRENHDATGGNYLEHAGSAYIFKNNAGTWSEIKKIVASDREANDLFGYPVSISGDYAIVGAYAEDHNATGGNYQGNAGSAYIFKNNAGTWSQVQKIVASDRWAGDIFGYRVAISGDYAIVGAYGEDHNDAGGNFLSEAGSAYIFKNIAGTWYQMKKIVASDGGEADLFGSSVSISGDYAIVGAWGEDHDAAGGNYLATAGSAYVFKNNAENWSEVQKIVASDREAVDMFGTSVVISGDYVLVGAVREDHDATGGNTLSSAGSAYIFKYCLSTSGTDVQTACDSFTWINNVTYTTSNNTATYTIINAAGCDSLVTLNLTINSSSTGTDVQTACDSLTWINNVTYTISNNTATYTTTNAAGCDSLVTLNLTINSSSTGTDVQTACNSFTWINNVTYNTSNNTATYTTTNAAGCDSVVTLNLTIINSSTGTDVQTACDSYTWINNVTYTASNNTATYTFTNAAGCDSVVTLNLTINYSNTGTDVQTACNSFTWINNVTYTASNNTATYTLTNAAGCDSVVTLNLTMNNSSIGTDVQTACNTFTWINNVTYTASNNTATYTLTNAAGCDSVVTLNLTINRVSDSTTTTYGVTIRANNASATYQWLDCDNNYAIINGETGQTFTATASGNYAVELTENGCVDTSACVAITIVGILENSFGNALLIYPNPTNGNFTIDLGAIYENAQILITDISGKMIESKTISQSQVLNLSIEEPAGIYIVSIQAGYKKAVIRLVKE